jgi:hypothetical protein
MVQLHGPTFDDVQSQGDVFTEAVLRAINRILSDVSQTLHGFISLDDVNVIRKKWTQEVDQTLLDHVGAAHMAGASITRINQHTALVKILGGHTASALVASPETPSTNPFQIPVVENTSATEGLTNARNRLLGVGDHVWETARSQLLEGLHNGEGVTALRDRVASAGELSSARAEVVARSETATILRPANPSVVKTHSSSRRVAAATQTSSTHSPPDRTTRVRSGDPRD